MTRKRKITHEEAREDNESAPTEMGAVLEMGEPHLLQRPIGISVVDMPL